MILMLVTDYLPEVAGLRDSPWSWSAYSSRQVIRQWLESYNGIRHLNQYSNGLHRTESPGLSSKRDLMKRFMVQALSMSGHEDTTGAMCMHDCRV
jgi:hypothetical protein